MKDARLFKAQHLVAARPMPRIALQFVRSAAARSLNMAGRRTPAHRRSPSRSRCAQPAAVPMSPRRGCRRSVPPRPVRHHSEDLWAGMACERGLLGGRSGEGNRRQSSLRVILASASGCGWRRVPRYRCREPADWKSSTMASSASTRLKNAGSGDNPPFRERRILRLRQPRGPTTSHSRLDSLALDHSRDRRTAARRPAAGRQLGVHAKNGREHRRRSGRAVSATLH